MDIHIYIWNACVHIKDTHIHIRRHTHARLHTYCKHSVFNSCKVNSMKFLPEVAHEFGANLTQVGSINYLYQ